MGASTALNPALYRKLTDQRYFFRFGKRKLLFFIFQKHNTFRCDLLCQFMMGFWNKRLYRRLFICLCDQLKQTANRNIHLCFGNFSFLHSLQYRTVIDASRRRHFQILTGLQSLDAIVRRAPVRNDQTFIGPFVPQNIIQYFLIFRTELTV